MCAAIVTVNQVLDMDMDKIFNLENIRQRNPIFCREVPMLLEEIFMAEMEENGYDIRKVLQ